MGLINSIKKIEFNKNTIYRGLFILFTVSYIAASWLFHVEVSKLVVGKYKNITGDFVPRDHSIEFSIIVIMLILIFLSVKAIKGERRIVTLAYIFLYLIVMVLFYSFLSLHQVEIIHIVQYSSIIYLLGLIVDKNRNNFAFGKLLFLGTALGIIDELLQYYIIAPGHKYLDFNDLYLNLLGVIFGLLLFYGFKNPPLWDDKPLKPFIETTGFRIIIMVGLIVSYLYFSGHLKTTPPEIIPPGSIKEFDGKTIIYLERKPGHLGTWQDHFVRGKYYALEPFEGMGLIFLVGFIFATFDPRYLKQFKLNSIKNSNEPSPD